MSRQSGRNAESRDKEELGLSSRRTSSDKVDHKERARLRDMEIEESGDSMNMFYEDPFYIDPKIIPEGWVYHWACKMIHGTENSDNRIGILQSQNWSYVPPDRHPELARKYRACDKNGEHQNYLFNRGMVLMETTETQYNKKRELLRSKNQHLVDSSAAKYGSVVKFDKRERKAGFA